MMKKILALKLYLLICIPLLGQIKENDSFIYDSLNINGFYLGSSINQMKKLFGEPVSQYHVKPQPDCEEWCEKEQVIYYYGEVYYDNSRIGYTAIAGCEFKELLQPEIIDTITAFSLRSKKNDFVLEYRGVKFFINDSINNDKYHKLIPKGFQNFHNLKDQGKNMPFISAKLVDSIGMDVYSNFGVDEIRFYFDKKGILKEISIEYPLE